MFNYNRLVLFSIIFLRIVDTLSAQKSKQLFLQTPGMVSYTYRQSFAKDIVAKLDTLKTLGINDIEFSNLFGRKATDIRALLDDRGQKCSSFGVSYADFSHSSTIGFLQWGFWKKAHWLPSSALWDKDWNPRKHGKVFTELVSKT